MILRLLRVSRVGNLFRAHKPEKLLSQKNRSAAPAEIDGFLPVTVGYAQVTLRTQLTPWPRTRHSLFLLGGLGKSCQGNLEHIKDKIGHMSSMLTRAYQTSTNSSQIWRRRLAMFTSEVVFIY